MSEISTQAQRHDRWVNWIVIAVFVLALLGGWVVKTAAEGRTVAYTENGLDVRYPAGWMRANVQAPVLLQVEDKTTKTAITLEKRPVPTGADPLAAIQQNLTLERGRQWTAYRALETRQGTEFAGHQGLMVTFAYVEANPDPFKQKAPVVMKGTDFIFAVGNEIYLVTLTATEANYAGAQRALQTFVQSLPK